MIPGKCKTFSFPLQNLLLTDDSEGAELKVVDFGFARLKPKRDLNGEVAEGGGMRTPCFTLQVRLLHGWRHLVLSSSILNYPPVRRPGGPRAGAPARGGRRHGRQREGGAI